jgi:hypothetical protein
VKTSQELGDRFEGLTRDLVKVEGIWKFRGMVFEDNLIRLRIDSGDPAATDFLKYYKETLKERFRQLDIWITAHEIEMV